MSTPSRGGDSYYDGICTNETWKSQNTEVGNRNAAQLHDVLSNTKSPNARPMDARCWSSDWRKVISVDVNRLQLLAQHCDSGVFHDSEYVEGHEARNVTAFSARMDRHFGIAEVNIKVLNMRFYLPITESHMQQNLTCKVLLKNINDDFERTVEKICLVPFQIVVSTKIE